MSNDLDTYVNFLPIELRRQLEAVVSGTTGGGGSSPPFEIKAYSIATRPAASTYAAGSLIFNTDTKTLNVSDGTNWYDNGSQA